MSDSMKKLSAQDIGELSKLSDTDMLSELKRRGIAIGSFRGEETGADVPSRSSFDRNRSVTTVTESSGATNEYCERCGGTKPSPIQYSGRRYCNCDAKFRAANLAIREIDLDGRMTFEKIDEDSDPSVLRTAQLLCAIATGERTQGVFMFGLPGRGKTHLQVATARLCISDDRLVGVYSLAALIARIQETYGYSDTDETKTKILEEVASHEVVILDDIGKEHRSPDTENTVYLLVDLLYRKKRTLIASSNLPGKDFVSRYDGAVLSRLGGLCEKVVIKGDDRREAEWSW